MENNVEVRIVLLDGNITVIKGTTILIEHGVIRIGQNTGGSYLKQWVFPLTSVREATWQHA